MRKMMNKMGLVVLMSLMTLLFFVVMDAVIAEEEQEIPDEINIENTGYKTNRKGPVTFSHGDHAESYEIACSECHHDYQDGKNVWEEGDPVKKCVACHSPLKSKGKIKKLSIAYHNNCKGCHKKLAKQEGGTEAPYKKCTDCHEKRS